MKSRSFLTLSFIFNILVSTAILFCVEKLWTSHNQYFLPPFGVCNAEAWGLPDNTYLFSLLTKDRWPFILIELSRFNRLGKVSPISQEKMSRVPPCSVCILPHAHTHNPACSSPWHAAKVRKTSSVTHLCNLCLKEKGKSSHHKRNLTWARFSIPPKLWSISW